MRLQLMSEFQIKKVIILISKCPFNFDEFLVQYKIILEYLLYFCGTSLEVSSEYTVAEETCLEDTVADAFSGDAAADNSSVNGAARPQHSSDRCHDSENNNCNNQPRI